MSAADSAMSRGIANKAPQVLRGHPDAPGSSGDQLPAEDRAFDSVYPKHIQALSRRFWTPVSVARSAAQLFREMGARKVLDVGSGVGKFVLVAASAAPELRFVGVEQREHLVHVARRARARLKVPNVS